MSYPRNLLATVFSLILLLAVVSNVQGRFYADGSHDFLKTIYFVFDSWTIRDAAVEYLNEYPERDLRSITYGELVRNGFLPSSYCMKPPSKEKNGLFTCGKTSPGFEEFQVAKGPVLKKDLNRYSLIFIFPYRDSSTETVNTIKSLSSHAKLKFGTYREYVILYQFFPE